jgi:hypothetical protein
MVAKRAKTVEAGPPRDVKIAGYSIRQLSETEYEAENTEEKLDFHFDMAQQDGTVEVSVFDSNIPPQSKEDPFLEGFFADSLDEAVREAMKLKR